MCADLRQRAVAAEVRLRSLLLRQVWGVIGTAIRSVGLLEFRHCERSVVSSTQREKGRGVESVNLRVLDLKIPGGTPGYI